MTYRRVTVKLGFRAFGGNQRRVEEALVDAEPREIVEGNLGGCFQVDRSELE